MGHRRPARGHPGLADFASEGDHGPRAPKVTGEPARRTPGAATTVVEFLGRPPDLLLAHDDNLADIARELSLFGASHADSSAVRAAAQIVEVVRASALSWDAARLVAKQALLDGVDAVDIAIAVMDPEDLPHKVQVLRRAVGAAEQMMAAGQLIAMPADEAVQEWRDWVEGEMTEQATTGRAPMSYAAYRAR